MKKKHPEKGFFQRWYRFFTLVALMLFAFVLMLDASSDRTNSDQRYEIKCLDANGLLYTFIKPKEDWWRTSHGTLVVMDNATRYTFDKGRCTYKAID